MHAAGFGFNRGLIGRLFLFCTLFSAFIPAASGQTLNCVANVANQPTMRQESVTEPVGDIIINCTASSLPLSGAAAGPQTVMLSVSGAAITSRQLFTGVLPPASVPTEAALLVNDNTSNPTQGFLQAGALVFSGFTFPTSGSPSFTLRITNVRVNANSLASGAFVTGTVLATFGLQNQSNLVLGVVESSLSASVSAVSTFSQCQSLNTTITTFTVKELVNTAFKSPAASASNSTPGQWYQLGSNSESQTVLQNFPAGWINQLGAVPGQANAATRIRVSVSNLQPGVNLTLPVSVTNSSGSLVATSNGDIGPFSAAPGNGIVLASSYGLVTYEVRSQSPGGIDSFSFPMTITSSGNVSSGTVLVSATYAATSAETSTVIPRFADTSVLTQLMTFQGCGPATKLGFIAQPVNTAAGALLPAVIVGLEDSNGSPVISTAPVTLTSNPPAVSTTVNAVNGIATFSNLVFGMPGTYTFTASSSGLTSATSVLFTITQGVALPDLVITSLTTSNTGVPGGNIPINMTVANQGNAAAGTFGVEFYFSSTAAITTSAVDTGWNCKFNGGLAPGNSTTCSGNIVIPGNLSAGTWYFGAIADPSNQVVESNKSNNARAGDSGTVVVTNPTISGNVVLSGVPIGGVTVMLSGSQTGSTTTDSSGNYTFSVVAGGTYTVTAALSGYTILPLSQTLPNLTGSQVVNFAATAIGNGVTVSGYATVSGVGQSGVTITVNGSNATGAVTLTTATDTSGHYTVVLAAGGTYTLSAALAGYIFSSPATFPNLSSTQTASFTGSQIPGMVFVPVIPCRVADTRAGTGFSGLLGPPSMLAGVGRSFPVPSSSCGIPSNAAAYSLNVTVVPHGYLGYLSIWPTGQPLPVVSTLNSYSGTVVANAAIVPAGANGAISIYTTDAADVLFDINGYFIQQSPDGMDFFTVAPCRVADTRNGGGKTGFFGPPTMLANSSRSFPIPLSTCAIPTGAGAYSFNFTVVPQGYLGIFTTWPTGLSQPSVSTLNSYNGSVVANAAIVPAGSGGAISVEVTNTTDVLFDINGYFAPPPASGNKFYPVTPCRVADTRNGGGKSGYFGPPTMLANSTRSFPIPLSSCGIPATATAYSLNFTVVPKGYLGVFTTWPAGLSQPVVSTLNSYSGAVTANAAIVPAGTGGAINVYVTDATDVLFDINGYFAK